MSSYLTSNLSLHTWAPTDNVKRTEFNDNFGKLDVQIGQINTNIGNIGTATPKGVYATLSALQTAYPSGTTGVFVVTADGKWYYWSSTVWVAGGTYQSTAIAPGQITPDLTSFFKPGKNLFNKSTSVSNTYVNYVNGLYATSTGNTASDYIAVKPNTQYTVVTSTTLRFAFYDSNKVYISGTNDNNPTIMTPGNAAYVRYSFLNDVNVQQFELGATSTSYEAYVGQQFDASQVKPGTLTPDKTTFMSNGQLDGALVGNATITPSKTTFFNSGKNMFNIATATDSYYVDYTTGNLIANVSYTVSDYIPVLPSTQYSMAADSILRIAYYDSTKRYISGSNTNVQTITTPSNAAYVRYSFTTSTKGSQQFEQGSAPTTFQAYYAAEMDGSLIGPNTITGDKLQDSTIGLEKTSFSIKGKNLFNKATATKDNYINYTNGIMSPLVGYYASDFIPVQPSTQYVITPSSNMRWAFYNAGKGYISGDGTNVNRITTPSSAAFLRYSFNNDVNTQQLEVGSTPTSYETYSLMALDGSVLKPGTVGADKLPNSSIGIEKFNFTVNGKNLFNKATATPGYYIGATSGQTTALVGYTVSDFISVKPSTQYSILPASNMRWAYYDSGKVFISGDGTNASTVTTPSNAAYLRYSFNNDVNSQQLEQGPAYTSYEPYFGTAVDASILKPGSVTPDKLAVASYNPSEIVVDMTKTDIIKFYIKGGNSQSNKYLRYSFQHNVIPFDPTGTKAQSNMDQWRLNEVYQVTRTGQWSFSDDYAESVVNTGEWECALHEKDASDFMGGYNHGDEILTNVFIQFDGVQKDLLYSGIFACKHIKFVQQSQLYRVFTQTPVANHLKVYEVTAEQGIHLYQEVKWLVSLTLSAYESYLTMFPIKRNLYADTTKIITDRFYRDSDYKIVDVSTVSNVNISGASAGLSGINRADVWSATSGISGRVTILQKPNISDENMFLSNSDSYNKFYFAIGRGDYTTSVNEVFKMETIWKLDVVL